MKNGKKSWFVVDGWIPTKDKREDSGYEGHECLMILNCNDKPAQCYLDIYFEDKDPIENIAITVDAKRIKAIRMDKSEQIGGVKIDRLFQYSVRVRSEIEVVVQFGRMDVTQSNCSYIGLMGYSE